jgi:hypothetical protein
MPLRAPRVLSAPVAVVAMAVLVAWAGCGGGDEAAPPPERPRETVDKLPKLPAGWHEYVNHQAGFAIGRAPGWRAQHHGAGTLLRSPDRLVAISISAERTTEAIDFPLDKYAFQAAEALPGFKGLKVRRPHRFKAQYNAQAVEATGRSKHGVRQELLFIAMRRDHVATYAVLVAGNAEKDTRFYTAEALRMVRTLRGRPVA